MRIKYQVKIAIFFIALIASIQAVTLIVVYKINQRNAFEQIKSQLISANTLIHQHATDRIHNQLEAIEVLSTDFGFREAIATEDHATIQSALFNLGTRIDASRVVLVSNDYKILGDTVGKEAINEIFPFAEMIDLADEAGFSHRSVIWNDHAYEFSILPILAPTPIAWIGVGFEINNALAQQLQNLSILPLDLTFIGKVANQPWNFFATSEPTHQHVAKNSIQMFEQQSLTREQVYLLHDHVTLLSAIETLPDYDIAILLQYSLTKAMAPYNELIYTVIFLSLLGMLIAILGSVVISRNLATPIRKLAVAAKLIQRGQYDQPVEATQHNELGDLANTFNHMMDGIAKREAKITYQARHDTTTGLPNRVYFEEQLHNEIIKCQSADSKFAIVLISIDRFAEINYTLGHHIGDELAKYVGTHLRNSLQDIEVIARIATDQFILYLPNINEDNALQHLEKITNLFEDPFQSGQVRIDVDLHIGVSLFPEHGGTPDCLMQRADVAMYLSQQSTKRSMIYDSRCDPYDKSRLSLMGEFKHGLKHEQFKLYFQPKVNIRTKQITHAECLIRWHHPEEGFLSPDQFVPLAEQTGHIQELTIWVIQQAIQQLAAWQQKGIDISLAINLSAKDLLYSRLESTIFSQLHNYHVSPDKLILEITESSVMLEPTLALKTIQSLHDKGLKFSIDDFGTGYSSMEYLKNLPLYELKIDKSFVQNLSENEADQAIVRSTIELGHNLGLSVTAEGVENEQILAILQSLGADTAQGYHFSKPIELQDFEKWLLESNWGIKQRSA